MAFQRIPRELQLSIIKQFDIDARIKTNIIHKLKIPSELSSKLNTINRIRKLNYDLRKFNETNLIVTLQLSRYKSYECYYDYINNGQYWYYVDTSNTASFHGFPYLSVIYPPANQRVGCLYCLY